MHDDVYQCMQYKIEITDMFRNRLKVLPPVLTENSDCAGIVLGARILGLRELTVQSGTHTFSLII